MRAGFRLFLSSILTFFFLGSVLTVAEANVFCPAEKKKKAEETEVIFILNSDETHANEYLLPGITVLKGNVRLRHKGMVMDCDSAYVNERGNTFQAFGHVEMHQGDTLHIYGDYLQYNGMIALAKLRYNCKLINRNTTLLTDSLNYDRLLDFAYYFEGGTMMDEVNVLTSEWGQYSLATKDSEFRFDVKLVNPQYTIDTDTLRYNTRSGVARIVGPSKIDSDTNHILADAGWYDSHADDSELTNRPFLYTDDGRKLQGDTVYYNRKEGYSIARRDVVVTDSINKNIVTGEYCYYNELIDSVLVTGRAQVLDYSQGDTVYLHGDTMKVRTFHVDTDSAYRETYVYYKVRLYKKDLQAVCDSMSFSTIDSCIRMYRDPIFWSGEQQQLGEYIYIYMNDSTIDHIHVDGQALSVERKDSIHYNQVSGREMWYYFVEGRLHKVDVLGNVLLRYYPEDSDKAMIGLNESTTSKFYIWMKDNKIHRMKMEGPSQGILHPMALIPAGKLYLENFGWFDYVRPTDPADIFNWRPKKSGTELQYRSRRNTPLPNRGLDFGAASSVQAVDSVAVQPADSVSVDAAGAGVGVPSGDVAGTGAKSSGGEKTSVGGESESTGTEAVFPVAVSKEEDVAPEESAASADSVKIEK